MGPCHHGMEHPRVADGGEGLHIWGVAANILNKLSWTSVKGWSSISGFGRGEFLTIKTSCYRMLHKALCGLLWIR